MTSLTFYYVLVFVISLALLLSSFSGMVSDKRIEEAYAKAVKVLERILGTKEEHANGGTWGETVSWEGKALRLIISIEEVQE